MPRYTIYPKSHYVTTRRTVLDAIETIKAELRERLEQLYAQNKLVEAQRLQQRTQFDLEMMAEVGYCNGIENYSRHLTGRMPGEPPPCLFDYLPPDALLVVDESHVTVPQIGAMYKGDRSRKETLVRIRLPPAVGARQPAAEVRGMGAALAAQRSSSRRRRASTSCAKSEGRGRRAGGAPDRPDRSGGRDPPGRARRSTTCSAEINERVAMGDRVLVTTLTKRMAENLTEYLGEHGVRVRYLHSDVETVERVEIIRDLRLGKFDVLVGINLLREGLDMPEVSLVAILDADKEGFLRSAGSLIQTIGRAARNVRGKAILYADRITRFDADGDRRNRPPPAEAGRVQRRARHHAGARSPSRSSTSWKARAPSRARRSKRRGKARARSPRSAPTTPRSSPARSPPSSSSWRQQMYQHARDLEFEEAAAVRDQFRRLKDAGFAA